MNEVREVEFFRDIFQKYSFIKRVLLQMLWLISTLIILFFIEWEFEMITGVTHPSVFVFFFGGAMTISFLFGVTIWVTSKIAERHAKEHLLRLFGGHAIQEIKGTSKEGISEPSMKGVVQDEEQENTGTGSSTS